MQYVVLGTLLVLVALLLLARRRASKAQAENTLLKADKALRPLEDQTAALEKELSDATVDATQKASKFRDAARRFDD